MKIGICDDVKEEQEKVRACIKEHMNLTSDDEIAVYFPEEIRIDMENNVFDCDIIVMDIDFKGYDYNGINLGKMINENAPNCQIIYLTYILNFAPDVYETNHCYFVLKNNMQIMLSQALQKAYKIYEEETKKEFLKITSDGHTSFIPVKDIIYIERLDRKIYIYTNERAYTCYTTLASLKNDLTADFVRCHKSFIIHLKFVTYMGSTDAELNNNIKVPLGKVYAAKVKEEYTKFWSDRV